jgi:hypothetical protein
VAAFIAAGAWGLGLVVLAWVMPHRPDTPTTPSEQLYLSLLIGLSGVSLLTLLLGLAGWLSPTVFAVFLAGWLLAGVITSWKQRRRVRFPGGWQNHWWLLATAPFLIGIALGSVSPQTDFDVKEYHLGGPKEWFLAGRITFLEHNVYTSFPFLTEMLLLAGMVVANDWYWGALAGQAVLALFAPLTALGLWCAGYRYWSPLAANAAACVWLSTPWVFRMSIIAYAEGGLTAYVFGAIFAAFLAGDLLRQTPPAFSSADNRVARGPIALAGFFAGSAMACKYPGLVTAIIPVTVLLTLATLRRLRATQSQAIIEHRTLERGWRVRRMLATNGVCLSAILLAVGPWLLKNTIETGNPVYPLGYAVFGGRDLDDDLAAKWARGHARPSAGSLWGEVRDFALKAFDVAAVNDWQSPLVFALAPLAWLTLGDRQRVHQLGALVAWQFLVWWGLTHHLDRFWLPLLPLASLLAGVGAAAARSVWLRWLLAVVVPAGMLFNLAFCATGYVGYHAGLIDLRESRKFVAQLTCPEIAWLNEHFRETRQLDRAVVLGVGEAEWFDAEFRYRYNTVFDRSLFEAWCGEPGSTPSRERPLRSPAAIRDTLQQAGVTHVLVNWAEVLRYRLSYGYTDFVHPQRLRELVDAGVLESLELPPGLGQRPADALNPQERQEVDRWAPELLRPTAGALEMQTAAIYRVR